MFLGPENEYGKGIGTFLLNQFLVKKSFLVASVKQRDYWSGRYQRERGESPQRSRMKAFVTCVNGTRGELNGSIVYVQICIFELLWPRKTSEAAYVYTTGDTSHPALFP